MNTLSNTHRLLKAWIESAPKRAEEVFKILADSGIDRATIEKELAIKVAKPDKELTGIPTFDPSRSQAFSPMLKARMEYAGTISDGTERWLGIKDMQKSMSSKRILRVFASLKENWENSAPARLDSSRLALFGFSPDRVEDLTLLAWEKDFQQEPRVVRYSGHNEQVFKNLDEFLRWANK